jgi:ABC-type polysaccharide/polyol phosphate transport system ATPase subunit
MSNIAIKAENLSKAYQLGEIGTGTISRDLERWYARMRGKEDPFLRIGETNDRTSKGSSDIVWSLKDINFEIEQGDAVGIIGRNGAGKSTLLKVLSRVTSPTSGRITGKGRIASLLEVGTGFHPELTGRENIYLNGAILGMRKKEITRKFDEIVDFAGVERYIDTPVKRYSSGMYVRLAFAVAAHLEPEILIVDEVLAVGDIEFQKKCLGKMEDVSKNHGRTILFVSHNIQAIKQLCDKSIVLNSGSLIYSGEVDGGIEKYTSLNNKISGLNKNSKAAITNFQFLRPDKTAATSLKKGEFFIGRIEFTINENVDLFTISIDLLSYYGHPIASETHFDQFKPVPLKSNNYYCEFKINTEVLKYEPYQMNVHLIDFKTANTFDSIFNIALPPIQNVDVIPEMEARRVGAIRIPIRWEEIIKKN